MVALQTSETKSKILMDEEKLKKLLAYMDFPSYEIEIVGYQEDEVAPHKDKMCCGCCEPACSCGPSINCCCGWVWSRQWRGADYLEDTGPPPLTKSDEFRQVFVEPRCMIKYLKRGTESYIMIISYTYGTRNPTCCASRWYGNHKTNSPEVTIVPLDLIPPGHLGCDFDGNVVNFYTWPKECLTEDGEKLFCCFVCDKKQAVTAKGTPFASVGNIHDPQAVVARIHQLRGLCGKGEFRKLLTREYCITQLGEQEENKGVLNIYNEGFDTEDFSVRVDFNNDQQVDINAYKESEGVATQRIQISHQQTHSKQLVQARAKRDWFADDLHVYHQSGGNSSQATSPAVPTMESPSVDSPLIKL